MIPSTTDATVSGDPNREGDAALLARLVANALNESVTELRKDNDMRMFQITATFREELSTFREGEEKRLSEFREAIASWKQEKIKADPTTNFWTVYKTVADEYDKDLVSQYSGDLETTLTFAGLFSGVTSAFIVQIIPGLQPNPISNVHISVVRAQTILFASLSVTLFVAFLAVLGKQWILYYTRASTWGNVIDRGEERHRKLMGLQKWGLHLIMESIPVMLQFSLLLFGVALSIYLWDFDISAAKVALVVTAFGFVFYTCVTVAAMIWSDCPFQTPVSLLLPEVWPWTKKFSALTCVWLRQWLRRKDITSLHWIERLKEHCRLTNFLGRPVKNFADATTSLNPAEEDTVTSDQTLSNPAFWRPDPLFTSPISEDAVASSGFWLLENSTDFSTAATVAAIFSEFQWPSHHPSSTALIRFRDIYMEYLRAPKFDEPTRLKALQSATAYYLLYHTRLIWSTWKSFEVKTEELPPSLLPDLFLHQPNNEWGADDVFEYLLHIDVKDRTEPVKSARFLSYIAPYWFCGDADSAIRYRPSRLPILNELIEVLEMSQALAPATVTDCILCVGAAMDFPLHPEDLIRVDKSVYLELTFKLVVEHIHGIALVKGRRRRHAKTALEIIHTLVRKSSFLSVGATWINGLLRRAALEGMDGETFTVLLRFGALGKTDDVMTDVDTGIPSSKHYDQIHQDGADPLFPEETVRTENPTPEYALFNLVQRNVKACGGQKDGWRDDAVYGGLITIRDIPGLRTCLPEAEFLETLSKAMEGKTKGGNQENEKGDKPFRVRKAAYDVILAARDGWLRSAELRSVLEAFDIPRKLYNVVIETRSPHHQRSFLGMMEILSEDRFWHPYLRKAMDIWLPLHREGPVHALRILTRVGELLLPERDGNNVDTLLEKALEEEWAAVPGRLPMELTFDLLEPLAEVTEGSMELYFTEKDRRAVLAVVEQVIPRLEMRRDDNYSGPEHDVRHIIDNLQRILQQSIQSNRRRSTYW